MKKIFVLVIIISQCVFSCSSQKTDFEWEKKVSNVKATIKFLEDKETVVIVPDDNASMRYISQQLPEEYKKEGLKVTFSGWLGKIPPNVRMIGKPLKLKCICITSTEQKKFKLTKRKYSFK